MSVTQIKDGFDGGSDNQLKVNPDGSINVDVSGGGGGTTNVNITEVNGTAITGAAVPVDLAGLTAFQTSQYTVNGTAQQLTPTPMSNRRALSIKVITTSGTDAVYIGNSAGVTISTGYPIFNLGSLQLDLTNAEPVWAIGTSAGQLVYVLEIGD
jgi:hypothetical protein